LLICVSDSRRLMIKLMNYTSMVPICEFYRIAAKCEICDIVRMERLFLHCVVEGSVDEKIVA